MLRPFRRRADNRISFNLGSCVPVVALLVAVPLAAQSAPPSGPAAPPFTLTQIAGYPFPSELTAAPTGSRIAWALDEAGRRNLWVAEGPDFRPRQITAYDRDDGQELTSVQLTRDGRYVVYVRGGDHGGNWSGASPNPLSLPVAPKIQVWSVPFAGGPPKLLGDGDEPTVSPTGDAVAFIRDHAIWTVAVDGSAPARRLFAANGDAEEPQWAPNGSSLAFVSNRGDHAFIGIYTNDSTPISWLAPSTSRDRTPRWSPDGRRIAFVRTPGTGGAPDSLLAQRRVRWGVWTADVATGEGRRLWQAPATVRGSLPTSDGGANLQWAAGGRITFLSTIDGWPHLYSMPDTGGTPLLLTPGRYMAENVRLSADGRFLVFAANTGPTREDIDRRHLTRVPVDRAAPEVLTPGTGIESSPVVTGDGSAVAFFSATAQRPALPAVMQSEGGSARLLGEDRIPADFPAAQLVTPRQVVYKAPDGTEVHAQLFARTDVTGKRPALVFVHGGPQRQMLLGWHYMDYYANSYASNQYLAAKGYVVLSVNYRLGIGYGNEFHHPPNAGAQGAAEYQDVLAGARWLEARPDVDARRVGIFGGSYGGFLVALALGRNSDVFAAGVDVHGVHDFTTPNSGAGRAFAASAGSGRFEEAPDLERARKTAWTSSPVASVSTWRSPVLLIHGDDDRNVRFAGTVDLVRRLEAARVPFEEMVIVDDTHHMMRRSNWARVDSATAAFFDRALARPHD